MKRGERATGVKVIGPFKVTPQLHQLVHERARNENRSITSYIIDLVIKDAEAHGHVIQREHLFNGRVPYPVTTAS